MLNKMINYLVGNYRYLLYYSNTLKFLLRDHIVFQIDTRIHSMNAECYNSGQCKICKCRTTALQMCNAACLGKCYPKMLSKYVLNKMIMSGHHDSNQCTTYFNIDGVDWRYDVINHVFVKHEEDIENGLG